MTDRLMHIYNFLQGHWSIDFLRFNNSAIGTVMSVLLVAALFVIPLIVSPILSKLSKLFKFKKISGGIAVPWLNVFLSVIFSFASLAVIITGLVMQANSLVKQALDGDKSGVKKELYQTTVVNYRNRFETKKWLYNANIVYNQNIGTKNASQNKQLNNEMDKQSSRLKTINHNLKKLHYINTATNLGLTYHTAKQLYPNVSTDYRTTIKPSQLADLHLQNDIKKSLTQK